VRAIVIKEYGGPEQLVIRELPQPEPLEGQVVIKVKAFGLNRAEIYFRKGVWGQVAKISGIECVGNVEADPSGLFLPGQKVIALMGGMGRTIDGSYAQYVRVPLPNVVAIETGLSWTDLAALPESYATAWTCLHRNLALSDENVVLVRGATSALGQAAVNIAAELGARIIATTRNRGRLEMLKEIGAHIAMLDATDLSAHIRRIYPRGIDGVLDLIGNSTLLDSLAAVRPGGRVCIAGFLGGSVPIDAFDPLLHLPSGVHLSFFASAFTFGTKDYPLSGIPFQRIADLVAAGTYRAKPARIFPFEQIQDAHRLIESNRANGKIVISVD
jgi:NADPH2:quinone reductase